jgi:hypothetical protein
MNTVATNPTKELYPMTTATLTATVTPESPPDHLEALGDVSGEVMAELLDAAALLEEVSEVDTSGSPAPQRPPVRASEGQGGSSPTTRRWPRCEAFTRNTVYSVTSARRNLDRQQLQDDQMTSLTHTRRRARPVSPAAHALGQQGFSLQDIADSLGTSREYVGMCLAGTKPVHDRLIAALEEVLGREGAGRVLIHVPEREVAATPRRD